MNTTNNTLLHVTENELTAVRTFQAPSRLVWEMWTNPEHITHWWGPRGFSTTTNKMEVKPGGIWRFVMHGPDGRDYQNKIVYLEVDEPNLLVYKHKGEDDTGDVSFHVNVHFEDDDDGTKITMRMVFDSAEELERVNIEFGAIDGLKQTLERLGDYLTNRG